MTFRNELERKCFEAAQRALGGGVGEMEPRTLEFIKSLAVGTAITSAADFRNYVAVGLNRRLNLGLHESGFHLVSTEEPIEDNRL